MDFAPLNVISGYSFLQSGLTPAKITKAIKDNGYFGVGLSDYYSLYGVPAFVKTCTDNKIPFIVGMKIKINDYLLSLFIKNEEGYRNLILINNLQEENKISLDFLKKHCVGLICVLETKSTGFIEKFNINAEEQDIHFKRELLDISALFKQDFYLGIEVTSKEENQIANSIRKFAFSHSYETIAFPKIRYVKKDDAIVVSIVEAIANDETLDIKQKSGQEYFMSISNYAKIYTKKEIENTINVFENNDFNYYQKRGQILKYPVENPHIFLKEKCFNKLEELKIDDSAHKERLEYELSIIEQMGYPDYFLLVADYVSFAKNNDILVGPGRGSAAGALVSYLLNITEIDPLTENLQFERFLNPYRHNMPDIDVDFMDIKREEIVEYTRQKYGKNKVANIVTFTTIQAKQAIRDIGRVYKIKTSHLDILSKCLTNPKLTLRESYKTLKEFKDLVDSDKYFLEIVSLASKIEGLPRQTSLHAAGIILNNEDLLEILPVSYDFNGNLITQYEMQYLEEQGFLKMDFLALRNLTTIYQCLNLINSNHPELNLQFKDIPFQEKEIFSLISTGNTAGLFQIETPIMRKSISKIKPNCFEDIVALLALGRPGPMESIPEYVAVKEGKKAPKYISKELEPILKSTNGIIVYEEQVNQIAQVMAGFSMGEADLFRRAIKKKKMSEMDKLKSDFINGSIKNGYSSDVANKVFTLILKFANYGFNKSHSVVYSIIACRMAWLKLHYPLEFYASLLETTSTASDSKFTQYISEMKQRGLSILPPNINESNKYYIIKENSLLFPLNSIHGVNDLLVNIILTERNKGPFKDFYNFVVRMFVYKISESQLISLINSGALDTLYPSRSSMISSIKQAFTYAELIVREDGQLNLGFTGISYPRMIEEKDDHIVNLNKEYEALGIMLSNNPLKYKHDLLMKNNVSPISDIIDETGRFTICGIIKEKKIHVSKNKQTMAFIKIFDETNETEIIVFSSVYQNCYQILDKNNIILVKGNNRLEDEGNVFLANEITLLEEAGENE